jgi:uncharacterized repeat protein (TIGR03803 family)
MRFPSRIATRAALFTCAIALTSAGTSFGSPVSNPSPTALSHQAATTTWTETILHTFQATSTTDGHYPIGVTIDGYGDLYGLTNDGGTYNRGTAYILAPLSATGTWNEVQLHSFHLVDGSYPVGTLIAADGSIYGATQRGGIYNDAYGGEGTVFRLTRSGNTWNETVLYNFRGVSGDGAYPTGPLIMDRYGALYGTTGLGGTRNAGTVYKLSPPAKGNTSWTETVLHSFGASGDGGTPNAGVIMDTRGALYGTAEQGGIRNTAYSYGGGIVFKLTPPTDNQTTWTETVLHAFTGINGDGATPFGNLIADREGALYSTTLNGGASGTNCEFGCGIVFQLPPPAHGQTAWTENIIYNFTGFNGDGAQPVAGLVADRQGVLYGTTTGGGLTNGGGTAYALTPPTYGQTTWTESILHTFGPILSGDGFVPTSTLAIDKLGNLYGTTSTGGYGNPGNGIVFKLTRPAM